jgi:hypothetical protein
VTNTGSRPPSLRIVELVGPAGSGKSTAFHTLLARSTAIEGRPTLRHREYAGFVTTSLLATLATLARSRAIDSQNPREQVRMMVYLQAMPRILAGWKRAGAVVFDQGPLYFLTRRGLMNPRLATWRGGMFDTWAPLLDLVVFLDAPDDLLADRINIRDEWHALKGADGRSAIDVLRASREVYERAIDEVSARPDGPVILRFDTSARSAGEITDAIVAAIAGDDEAVGPRANAEPVPRRNSQ